MRAVTVLVLLACAGPSLAAAAPDAHRKAARANGAAVNDILGLVTK